MELCFVLLCKHTVFLCFFYVRAKRGQARHPARSPVPFPSNDTRSLNASLPATQAHSLPSFPRLPMSPAPCRHKAPPWVARPMIARPLPIRRPAPYACPIQLKPPSGEGSSLQPYPPLHPRVWHGNRPPWPGVVCCPHPPGAALLPGREVLGQPSNRWTRSTFLPLFICHHPPLRVSTTL